MSPEPVLCLQDAPTAALPLAIPCGQNRLCENVTKCLFRPGKVPLYCIEFFKQHLKDGNWQLFNKIRVVRALRDLDWDADDMKAVLLSIKSGCFQKTVPDRIVTDLPGYDTVVADQYLVHWDEDEKKCVSDYHLATVSFSLKVAVISDDLGELSGVVTFHLSN